MDPKWFEGGEILQQMGPEGLAKWMGMAGLEADDKDLQAQIAQANEMRITPGPQRYGAAAGGLQAIADILRAYKGRQMEGRLRKERKELQGTMSKNRAAIAGQMFPAPPEPISGIEAPQMIEPEYANVPELLRRSQG